eukprot:1147250-Pelagomonas_calceolata.AAC.6
MPLGTQPTPPAKLRLCSADEAFRMDTVATGTLMGWLKAGGGELGTVVSTPLTVPSTPTSSSGPTKFLEPAWR